jgi:molybdate transport system ATP-binding protein
VLKPTPLLLSMLSWYWSVKIELSLPIIYVSHLPDEVARLADHLVLLEQGRVVASGPLKQVLSRIDLPHPETRTQRRT